MKEDWSVDHTTSGGTVTPGEPGRRVDGWPGRRPRCVPAFRVGARIIEPPGRRNTDEGRVVGFRYAGGADAGAS